MPVPYDIELSDSLQKKIRKLQRKDPQSLHTLRINYY